MTRYLFLDFETRCDHSVTKVGAYRYATDPSTEILCVAWRWGTKEELPAIATKVWSPFVPSPYGELVKALCDPDTIIVAHNALFEQLVIRFVLSKIINRPELKCIPHERFICTAARGSALALPRALDKAAHAIGLPVEKDKAGHRLMLKLSKPRKPTKNNRDKWHRKMADLKRVMQYCGTDIDVTVAYFLATPGISAYERKVWALDQKINFRGLRVDLPLVKTVRKMISDETERLDAETVRITKGLVTSARRLEQLKAFLSSLGLSLPNLQKQTIEEALLSGHVHLLAKRLLEIRQDVSRTSTKKIDAFIARTSEDDLRLRDIQLYWGASTGRFTGVGVQPHNFPQGKVKGILDLLDVLATGDLDYVRLFFDNPMEGFSSALRPMIEASPGKLLFSGDWNAIEARILFWLADHQAGLKAFRDGRNLYCELGHEIYRRTIEKEVDTAEYDVSKRAFLGNGFGMGPPKFQTTCKKYGVVVSDELAKRAVEAYRTTHYPVPAFWRATEDAAIKAVRYPGKRIRCGKIVWFVKGQFLWCELPSGRRLAYFGPTLRQKKTPWGEMRPCLYHWGVNPITRKWENSGTYGGKLVENLVQGTARDIMVDRMFAIEEAGFEIQFMVHDEINAENDEKASLKEYLAIQSVIPEWADGLPLKVAGWSGKKYRKG